MVLLGVIAALTTHTYWQGVADRTFPKTQPGEAAGAVAWDRAAAEGELRGLAPRLLALENNHGDTRPLIEDARRLVERYPRFAAGRTFFAQVLLFAGDVAGGYEQLQESLHINRQQADVQDLAGAIARQLKHDDQAAAHFGMAVNLAPQNAHYRVNLAMLYLDHKDFDRALKTLLEAIHADSGSHEAYAALADLYTRQGKLDQAIDQYTKALAATPIGKSDAAFAYRINKAMIQRRANHPADALKTLDALSDQQRQDPRGVEAIALCWAQLADFSHAAQVYEDALVLAPTQWRLEVEATRYRIKAGDFDKAAAHIQMLEAVNEKLSAIPELKAELKAARERAEK
jgi:tetratricopeptide (TPR) repeat protein